MEDPFTAEISGRVDRIALRYPFEARIRISVRRGPQTLVMEGWARDLSESGLGAFVASGLNLDEDVTLQIPLTSSSKLTVPAKVARSLGTQYGFRFTALSPDQRAAIQSAMKGGPEISFPLPK